MYYYISIRLEIINKSSFLYSYRSWTSGVRLLGSTPGTIREPWCNENSIENQTTTSTTSCDASN